MSRITPDDQLKFLLSCIRHADNGRVNFEGVAKECSIVSKGAAAKRYERLLKANGINPNGGPSFATIDPTDSTSRSADAPSDPKPITPRKTAGKKRKFDDKAETPRQEEGEAETEETEGRAGSRIAEAVTARAKNGAKVKAEKRIKVEQNGTPDPISAMKAEPCAFGATTEAPEEVRNA